MTSNATLSDLAVRAAAFTAERDWAQFHDPKSLTLALVGEVGELAELLQHVVEDLDVDVLQTGDLRRQ